MRKEITYILLLVFFISCNKEDSGDCFQATGDIIQQEFEVETFKNILIHERVELILEQGETQKVIIETGENLLPDVSLEVVNNELIVKDNNACNFVRDYGVTKVYVTSPDIYRIRNASEQNVSSKGALKYPSIYLMSVGDKTKYLPVGDFNVHIENEDLKIWSNGQAVINIEGYSNTLDVNLSDGDTRLNAQDFVANEITVNQISSNDILVYPVESLTGNIYSTGNVISYNKPQVVDVVEHTDYGKLIFK